MQILDVFQCIERLHELGTASLRKLITRGTQLSVPKLDRALPFKVIVPPSHMHRLDYIRRAFRGAGHPL